MAQDTATSPAETPELASAVTPEVQPSAVPAEFDVENNRTPADKMRASIAARKKTIAATMVYAGPGRPKREAASPSVSADAVPDQIPVARKSGNKPASRRKARTISRAQLVNRLANAVAGELDLIEQITEGGEVDISLRTESERRARTLATLARTLSAMKKVREDDAQRPDHDDDRPRDLDELRRRLSERLAAKLRGGSALPAGGDVAGRNEPSG